MELTGHLTDAVFRRLIIIIEDDLRNATQKLAEYRELGRKQQEPERLT